MKKFASAGVVLGAIPAVSGQSVAESDGESQARESGTDDIRNGCCTIPITLQDRINERDRNNNQISVEFTADFDYHVDAKGAFTTLPSQFDWVECNRIRSEVTYCPPTTQEVELTTEIYFKGIQLNLSVSPGSATGSLSQMGDSAVDTVVFEGDACEFGGEATYNDVRASVNEITGGQFYDFGAKVTAQAKMPGTAVSAIARDSFQEHI